MARWVVKLNDGTWSTIEHDADAELHRIPDGVDTEEYLDNGGKDYLWSSLSAALNTFVGGNKPCGAYTIRDAEDGNYEIVDKDEGVVAMSFTAEDAYLFTAFLNRHTNIGPSTSYATGYLEGKREQNDWHATVSSRAKMLMQQALPYIKELSTRESFTPEQAKLIANMEDFIR